MSRFLLVPLPLPGHAYPTATLARALQEQGHEVAWVGSEAFLRGFVEPDTIIYRTGMRPYRGQRLVGARAIKALWEGFVTPLARFLLPAVDRAVADWRPDVMVVDQHAFAGALVALRRGVAWATLATGMMELTRPFENQPKVDAWIHGQLADLWRAAGLPGEPSVDLRFSPHLVIASITEALLGGREFPEHFALVGPLLDHRPHRAEFPWEQLAPDRQKVLVTMGTLAQDLSQHFYQRAVEAVAPLGDRLQAILVSPPEWISDPPRNVLVTPSVPMLALMPHMDAVICHSGQNTMCEALAHGVPLVVAPIARDQPVSAGQVTGAGAAVRVHFHRVRPHQLRQALLTVLEDSSYAAAAERIGSSFPPAGGAPAAARRLAALASIASNGGTPVTTP